MTEEIKLTMKQKIEKLNDLQNILKIAKAAEMKMRKEVAFEILGIDKPGEAIKETYEQIKGWIVKVETKEELKIIDTEALMDLLVLDELTEEEREALKAKPDITLARANKLDADSQLWEFMIIKPSPTPTVTLVALEDD